MTALVSFTIACLAIWLSTYNAITGDLVTAAFCYTLAALLVAIEVVIAATLATKPSCLCWKSAASSTPSSMAAGIR